MRNGDKFSAVDYGQISMGGQVSVWMHTFVYMHVCACIIRD